MNRVHLLVICNTIIAIEMFVRALWQVGHVIHNSTCDWACLALDTVILRESNETLIAHLAGGMVVFKRRLQSL